MSSEISYQRSARVHAQSEDTGDEVEVCPSEHKVNKYTPSKKHLVWLSILFKRFDFANNMASVTILMGTSENKRQYGIRVNDSPMKPSIRRHSPRLTLDAKLEFKKREVYSTFPYVIDEYTCLFELASEEVEDSEGNKFISRPVLAIPSDAPLSYVFDYKRNFMDSFIPGSLLIHLNEEKCDQGSYYPRFRVRVLKMNPVTIPLVRFYTPVCGMTLALILSRDAFPTAEGFHGAVLSIVMTLTIGLGTIIREYDTGELILFNLILLSFFSSLSSSGENKMDHNDTEYEKMITFAPLLSLVVPILSWINTKAWLHLMCVDHDGFIQNSRGDSSRFTEIRKRRNSDATSKLRLMRVQHYIELGNLLVTDKDVLYIDDGEISDFCQFYRSLQNVFKRVSG